MERLDQAVARVLADTRRQMDERAARAKRRPESPGCEVVAVGTPSSFVVTRQGGERTQTGAPGAPRE